MTAEYEPGTLWTADGFVHPLLRTQSTWVAVTGNHYIGSDLSNLRPLIVLDPDELGLVPGDGTVLCDEAARYGMGGIIAIVLNAVGEQVPAARPEPLTEPEAVGSVVWTLNVINPPTPWMRVPISGLAHWTNGWQRVTWGQLVDDHGPLSLTPPDAPSGHELTDDRPHSRACGWRDHAHGSDCSRDCPTCGGRPWSGRESTEGES
jgi:hypothetical protein